MNTTWNPGPDLEHVRSQIHKARRAEQREHSEAHIADHAFVDTVVRLLDETGLLSTVIDHCGGSMAAIRAILRSPGRDEFMNELRIQARFGRVPGMPVTPEMQMVVGFSKW